MDLYCIFCTQEDMTISAVCQECPSARIQPILVMRHNGGNRQIVAPEKTVVPCFLGRVTALNFCRRNLPDSWGRGVVNITDPLRGWVEAQGWELIRLDFPRLVKDAVKLEIEVAELPDVEVEVSLHGRHGARTYA